MTANYHLRPAVSDGLAAALAPDLVAIIGHLAAGTYDTARPAALTSDARESPGVVKIRLSGTRADIEAVTAVLAERCEVRDRHGPHRNRYEPGERVYLTIRGGRTPTARDHHT